MREGPDIAHIANLVGDPARANMLTALVGGTALTASELAQEAGVMLPTASSHLAKLTAGGLLKLTVQGRHRYFALAGPHIAAMLESIMGVAATVGPQRVRPGPRDKPMREARVCYDHLAGDLAVAMLDGLLAKGVLVRTATRSASEPRRSRSSRHCGIDVGALSSRDARSAAPASTGACGARIWPAALGAAILDKVFAEKWARRESGGRVVTFSPKGRQAFASMFLAEQVQSAGHCDP